MVGLGTPLLTFLGVVAAQLVTRRGDEELETRSRREETMRTMRWAAELSASSDPRTASLGVAELDALLVSVLLDDADKVFVDAALAAVLDPAQDELDRLGEDGEVARRVPAGARPAAAVVMVTDAQRAAAEAVVRRAAVTGRPVPDAVRRIAGATGRPTTG